jgi:RNA polymerase primary sigma factor
MKTATARRGGHEFEDLAPYLDTIRDYPPLSREDEHRLAVQARRGDATARQRLVRHNLAFVVAVARKQRRGAVRLDDVIQEGNVGLMRAVEKFDPDAGTRFSTYAVWWIRAYIGKYLKEARSSVRPQSGTVAQADLSLDSAVDDENETTHLERIEDDSPGPEDNFMATEANVEVRDALGRIRKRVGTSSTTGCSRTSRARWRRSASAGASPASGCARSSCGRSSSSRTTSSRRSAALPDGSSQPQHPGARWRRRAPRL